MEEERRKGEESGTFTKVKKSLGKCHSLDCQAVILHVLNSGEGSTLDAWRILSEML